MKDQVNNGLPERYGKLMNCEAIFESSPVAMFILDETTNIVMVNLAAVKMCGGTEEDIVQHRPGNAFRCIHSSKDPRGCGYAADCKTCVVRNAIEGLILNGGAINGAEVELTILKNDCPERIWMSVGVEPVKIDDLRYWCVAMNEITERKLLEISLKNKIKEMNDFISTVVDRELKMVELKDEINELLKSAGKPKKY